MAGPIDPIDDTPIQGEGYDGAAVLPDSTKITPGAQPIEKLLHPDTQLHRKVLSRVMSRVNNSARYRKNRYDDWDRVDERMRLFVSLSRKARFGDKTTDDSKKEMPFKRAIVMPISLAIAEVRRAQKLSLYLSRNPVLQIDGRSPDDIDPAKMMEAMLSYDADQTTLPLVLSGMFGDADKYGEGTVYDTWEIERGTKRHPPAIQMIPAPFQGIAAKMLPNLLEPRVERNVPVKEGNRLRNVDPFCYFPDPRIPLSRIQEMEHTGHLAFVHRLNLIAKSTKFGGPYFNLDYLSRGASMEARAYTRSRIRDQVGSSEGYSIRDDSSKESGLYAIDHQQIKIIPREWGLGPEEEPIVWWFSVANEAVIIRAHESPYDHGQFTYSTAESQMDPHPTMNAGTVEMLDGIQRTCDWLINSRIANVRQMLNNAWAVMQTMVEMGDLENMGPGTIVRATDMGEKKLGNGEITWDQILHQIVVQDFTGPHGQLFETLFEQAQRMTAASDPAMGTQTPEERTLGEVQSMLAASSQRIAIETRLQDSAAVAPFVRRMIANRQQFTSVDQFYRIVGSAATPGADRQMIGADDVQGDFDYVPNTGVNPADPARFAQTWQQLLQLALTSGLGQQARPDGKILDLFSIFDETVRAMGIRDIDQFYTMPPPPQMPVQVMPDEQVQQQVQQGNMVPAAQAPPQ